MAQPPPRPAASRQGGPASAGASSVLVVIGRARQGRREAEGEHVLPRAISERGRRDPASAAWPACTWRAWTGRRLPEVGGDQAHSPALGRGRSVRRHVPGRGADRRQHQSRQRRPGVRAGQGRQYLLDRHGVPPRRTSARGDAALGGARDAHRPRARRPHLLRRRRGPARRPRAALGKNGQLLSPGPPRRHAAQPVPDATTATPRWSTSSIAKVADRLSSTRAGGTGGKLAYMSPEQVRGAEVDRTTDIFALGVVLWEITAAGAPSRMDTDLDTLEKVQACTSSHALDHHPRLPAGAPEACVMKALSPSASRTASGLPPREFSRALQTFLVRSSR